MLNKSDPFIAILWNIHAHLKADYDYPLVIVGDTGTGKSMLALQIFETWYRCILKKPVTKDMISQINTDKQKWARKFKDLDPFDINIFDEGATGFESRQHMEKFTKSLTKLYNVFRAKRIFSIIILPSFFYLNKYFREQRLRGLIYVNRRGSYLYFSKTGIKYLNGYNAKRRVKSMYVAYPFNRTTFPDYKGVLRAEYDKMKFAGVEKIIDEVIAENEKSPNKVNLVKLYKEKVKKLQEKGKRWDEIKDELHISKNAVYRCFQEIEKEG